MKEMLSEELKLIQLKILENVHCFCMANGIQYSLAFGTLLGAVRHKGYIPWDDDIDIMMTRSNYEQFIKTYKDPVYSVVDHTIDSRYLLPFAKVQDSRTLIQEKTNMKDHIGVNIDIFPVDKCPCKKKNIWWFFGLKKFFNGIYLLKILSISRHRCIWKNILLAISQFLLCFISTDYIVKKMVDISSKYKNEETDNVAVVTPSNNKASWMVPKYIFENYSTILFEGLNFIAIKDYNYLLTAIYGDYMLLPERDKQITHHSFTAWWKSV